jgi:hypothetical protein
MKPNRTSGALLGAILFASLVQAAHSQEAAQSVISTERPTVGFSPDVIPKGSLQSENGVGVSFQSAQYLLDGPESLLRLGLTDHLEIRFLASNALYQSPTSATPRYLQTSDTAFSAKVLLAGPNTFAPKSAILSVGFPTGGPAATSGTYDPAVAAIWTQATHRGYFLNEVAEATLTNLRGARRAVWAASIAGGRALSDTVSIFAEYAPNLLADHSMPFVIDGGFAFTRRKTQQFDIRMGYSKDGNGSHSLITLGYSMRRDNFFSRLQRMAKAK